jgi:hypothetical protein
MKILIEFEGLLPYNRHMSYDDARNEEKDHAFTQTVRGGDWRALSHRDDLASEGATARRSEDRNTGRACLGDTARDAASGDEARPEDEDRTEAGQAEKDNEIDLLILPFEMISELAYAATEKRGMDEAITFDASPDVDSSLDLRPSPGRMLRRSVSPEQKFIQRQHVSVSRRRQGNRGSAGR